MNLSSSSSRMSAKKTPKKTPKKTRWGLAIIASLLGCLLAWQVSAKAIYRTSSSIVIDAETSNVLFENKADALAYPASLTKTMTLLLLFDKLRDGEWQDSKMLKVSSRAARRPKTRLGLRAGDRISVDLAIRSIVVLSANDVAVVVAENIAGNETAFAKRMTAKAKEIGMTNTRFANASGLPNKLQISTARDMAMLGVYILNNYPEYYHYFSINSFVFKKRTIFSHNRVLRKFGGADGFKTGFISRSGYNLLTSAERDRKRVVAVVLGGNSGSQRDDMMTFLLDRFLPYAVTYSNSFALIQMKLANRAPQGDLSDSYKRYVKPKKKKVTQKKVATAQKKRSSAKKKIVKKPTKKRSRTAAVRKSKKKLVQQTTKKINP